MTRDPIHLRHNAARHYCMDQAAYWQRQYADLVAAGRDRVTIRAGDRAYSDEALATFPRYNVLAAIGADVEHFVPADFRSLEELRQLLTLAGLTAVSEFTKAVRAIASDAMEDERRRFVEFISDPDLERFNGIPELPFRRILGIDEHRSLNNAFDRRWGKWYGGCEDRAETPPDAVTLHTQVMNEPGAYDRLRMILIEHGIHRLLELREWGDGYELDVAAARFTYTGAEGFWTSGEMDWMVYASHESSITFGGAWLIDRVQAALPDWHRYLYRGWDLAEYRDEA